jgi:hypothetical protein
MSIAGLFVKARSNGKSHPGRIVLRRFPETHVQIFGVCYLLSGRRNSHHF